MSKTTRQQEPTAEYWAQVNAETAARMAANDAEYAAAPVSDATAALVATFNINVAACNAAAPGEWVRTDPSGAFRQAGHAAV